jgi:hypothetical protein
VDVLFGASLEALGELTLIMFTTDIRDDKSLDEAIQFLTDVRHNFVHEVSTVMSPKDAAKISFGNQFIDDPMGIKYIDSADSKTKEAVKHIKNDVLPVLENVGSSVDRLVHNLVDQMPLFSIEIEADPVQLLSDVKSKDSVTARVKMPIAGSSTLESLVDTLLHNDFSNKIAADTFADLKSVATSQQVPEEKPLFASKFLMKQMADQVRNEERMYQYFKESVDTEDDFPYEWIAAGAAIFVLLALFAVVVRRARKQSADSYALHDCNNMIVA